MSGVHKIEKRKSIESSTDNVDQSASKRRKVIGPSFPGASGSDNNLEHNVTDKRSSDDDDDDDDIGPGLPPEGTGVSPSRNPVEYEVNKNNSEKFTSAPDCSKRGGVLRDDWMLNPPDSSDWASRVDPTKLKNRKFQSGRSVASRPAGEVDASWTETPEEKMKRLQNQVMGITSESPITNPGNTHSGTSHAIQGRIQKYQGKKAGQANSAQGTQYVRDDTKNDDDPSSRSFDKEKDMAITSRVTSSQRRDFINKASGFESRFTKGRYL